KTKVINSSRTKSTGHVLRSQSPFGRFCGAYSKAIPLSSSPSLELASSTTLPSPLHPQPSSVTTTTTTATTDLRLDSCESIRTPADDSIICILSTADPSRQLMPWLQLRKRSGMRPLLLEDYFCKSSGKDRLICGNHQAGDPRLEEEKEIRVFLNVGDEDAETCVVTMSPNLLTWKTA
ncbi:unnamed protein product, partial [Brassica oleracea var. botrytis]